MEKLDNYRMRYKLVQEWHNMRVITLFCGPTLLPMDVNLAEIRKLFTDSELIFVICLPHIFSHDKYSSSFPTLYYVLHWSK